MRDLCTRLSEQEGYTSDFTDEHSAENAGQSSKSLKIDIILPIIVDITNLSSETSYVPLSLKKLSYIRLLKILLQIMKNFPIFVELIFLI